MRKTLVWIGGLQLIPSTLAVILSPAIGMLYSAPSLPRTYQVLGWVVALGLPLAIAWWLRGSNAWMNVIAALWVTILGTAAYGTFTLRDGVLPYAWHELGPYWMCALGAIGLIAWGLKEARKERINLGVAGFALTVLFFYFSTVMDKLDRAGSLVGLGLLFLLGGWLLERTRRRLVAWLERGDR